MRVVLAVASFPKLSQTFVASKVTALLDAGVDVHVVCRASDEDEWAWYGSRLDRPDVRARVHLERVGRSPRAAALASARFAGFAARHPRAAYDYLRRRWRANGIGALRDALLDSWFFALRPDVLHFEFGSEAVPRLDLHRALGCRLTVSFRGFDLNFAGLEVPGYYDELWCAVDGVHCLGDDLWRRAQRRGCPPDVPHVLIPPAIDAAYFAPERRTIEPVGGPARPLRVLSVGRLHWKKGYPHALAAIRRVLDGGVMVDYRIAGRGPAVDEVQACVRDLGLDERVTLLGPLARADVRAQLQWADVLLHASISEGFANAVLEAQAMEVPVVCSDADGLAENVADGVTGFVVRRRRPDELANRLLELARDDALRLRMGIAGRQRVERQFRPELQIAELISFFERVTDGSAGRSATHA